MYENNSPPAAGNALLVCASFLDCVAGCGCGDGAFAGALIKVSKPSSEVYFDLR